MKILFCKELKNMYRRASKMDLDDISKLPGINKSVDELEKYLQKGYKFLYVYENAVNNIIGASLFGADDIDDDSYDSEIYGIYTRNVKDKESITAEILFDTKQELFNLGYRNLIVWCEENGKLQKYLISSGGRETKKREINGKIQTAYTYTLVDMNIE